MLAQYRRNNVCKFKLSQVLMIVHAHYPKIMCPILYFVLWLMMKGSPYIWFLAVMFGCIVQFRISNIFSILTSFSVTLLYFLPSYFHVYSWPIFCTCQLALCLNCFWWETCIQLTFSSLTDICGGICWCLLCLGFAEIFVYLFFTKFWKFLTFWSSNIFLKVPLGLQNIYVLPF